MVINDIHTLRHQIGRLVKYMGEHYQKIEGEELAKVLDRFGKDYLKMAKVARSIEKRKEKKEKRKEKEKKKAEERFIREKMKQMKMHAPANHPIHHQAHR